MRVATRVCQRVDGSQSILLRQALELLRDKHREICPMLPKSLPRLIECDRAHNDPTQSLCQSSAQSWYGATDLLWPGSRFQRRRPPRAEVRQRDHWSNHNIILTIQARLQVEHTCSTKSFTAGSVTIQRSRLRTANFVSIIAIGGDHACAFRRVQLRGRAADAACRRGDDRYLALEPSRHAVVLILAGRHAGPIGSKAL